MTPSSEITWGEIAIGFFTAVLAATTIFYAVQTRRTVDEIRLERVSRSIPYLVLGSPEAAVAFDLRGIVRRQLTMRVRNVGPGHAWILRTEIVDTNRDDRSFNLAREARLPLLVEPGESIVLMAYSDTLSLPTADRSLWETNAHIAWDLRYRDLDGRAAYFCRLDFYAAFDKHEKGTTEIPDVPRYELAGHRVACTVTHQNTLPPDKRRLAPHAWPRED